VSPAQSVIHNNDSRRPLVSVVLPVYNGEQFLPKAIETVLTQTFDDLELIISDNASTDTTAEIAAHYVRIDQRVRYLRHAQNLGVDRNWTFAALQARGKYLKWLSSSDYLAPNLLANCVDRLNADRSAVLCFPATQQIDTNDRLLRAVSHDFEVVSTDPIERFFRVVSNLQVNSPMIAGLIRRDAVFATLPLGNYPSADLVLTAKLSLHGRFVMLPEALFYRRVGDAHSTADRTPLQIERMYNPDATRPRRLIVTRRLLGYFIAALVGPVPLSDRLRAIVIAVRHAYWCRRYILQELLFPWSRAT